MCHCAVLVNSYVDSWISCLSDELHECFHRCYPVQLNMEGTYLSPLSFHSSFAAASFAFVPICSGGAEIWDSETHCSNKVFHIVVRSLKLMIKDLL